MTDSYEFIMLTADGCPHCASAKKVLEKEISSGKIIVRDVSSDNEALDLAQKHNVLGVPTMIIKNKATQQQEACELKADLKGVICKTKEVDF